MCSHDHNHDKKKNHNHNHGHEDSHEHGCCCHGSSCATAPVDGDDEKESFFRSWSLELITSGLFLIALILSWTDAYPSEFWRAAAYTIALLPAAWFIIRHGWRLWIKGDFLNEFTLMLVAAIGALLLGEYPEAVAVLLFYCIGEKLEDAVNDDVRRRVRNLLGNLPDKAVVIEKDGTRREVNPREVSVGSEIAVAPGERAPLDGELLGDSDLDFDTAAITGESVPRAFAPGQEISSGMIPAGREARILVTKPFSDSTMSRIMSMVENAASQKSSTETMMRRVSRWYTPAVFALALCVAFVPWIVSLFPGMEPWQADVWLRRSLIFLVCSCPCALIVSIPLSYFMAIGLAAKRGLLFKGSKYLDLMRRIDTVFLDKTGTVTAGQFNVTSVKAFGSFSEAEVSGVAAALDAHQTHPLAQAIAAYTPEKNRPQVVDIVVINHGVKGNYEGKQVIAGSAKLMSEQGIQLPETESPEGQTAVWVSIAGTAAGVLYLQDTPKADSREAISEMHALRIGDVEILSGDTPQAVKPIAAEVGADGFKAALLPGDKQKIVGESVKAGHITAFAGDGINDAPALAASDVGIAMGSAGTGIAMQSADVILVGDDLAKIPQARKLSKKVASVVAENVGFAFGVKGIVMILGACGIATLWAAVFADTGVTVCAVIWTILRLRKY